MTGAGYPQARILLPPEEGEMVRFGRLGVRFMIDRPQTGWTFALVEHPIGPRVLATPMHTHRHEDEYTYVLGSEVGVQVGDEVRTARPANLVFKPRNVPHAFGDAGDTRARALGIISPAGFEQYFRKLAPLLSSVNDCRLDGEALVAVMAKYGLEVYPCAR